MAECQKTYLIPPEAGVSYCNKSLYARGLICKRQQHNAYKELKMFAEQRQMFYSKIYENRKQ